MPILTILRPAAAALLLTGLTAGAGHSQQSPRTIETGVFDAAQATRGEQTFAGMCTGCHTAASHTGPVFMKNWSGYTLWDLFAYISNTMPKSDPGSLSVTEYGDLVAYILKLNGMPAGTRALPTDSITLKDIRIQTTPRSGPYRSR